MHASQPPIKTVILAGSGRSGTTWIQELINSGNQFRTLFEPFNSRRVTAVSHWNYRQYLRITNKSPAYISSARDILEGRTTNTWINKFNRNSASRKLLIKDIRINLCLGWMYRSFDRLSVVFLIRHPCAVAQSRTRLGWSARIQDFLDEEELVHDFLMPHKKNIEACEDKFLLHVYMWCIENIVPLTQFNRGDIHVAFYENICVSPEHEIKKIVNHIAEPFPQLSTGSFSKPSATSNGELEPEGFRHLSWKNHVSIENINCAQEICDAFGLGKLYGKDGRPLYDNNDILDLFTA